MSVRMRHGVTRAHIRVVAACAVGLTTLANAEWSEAQGRISTTTNNQIIVELAPEDIVAANPFDLNGRTLVFTPDGHGGYSRSIRSAAWEDDLGPAVADGAEIQLESFQFNFAGRRWGSFFVSRYGLITFGEPLTYSYNASENRFDTMSGIAGKFVTTPTISPLYKPRLGGWPGPVRGATQHVGSLPDSIVITWITTDPTFWVHGVRPEGYSRFQAVLHADGRIAFNYDHVTLGDGIVGLFANEEVTKGHLLAGLAKPTDRELPGHLDLLDASLYAVNAGSHFSNDSRVILEFTLRDRIPEPRAGEKYSYRLHFDADEPYWNHPLDWSDEDATWQIDVRPGGDVIARGRGVRRLLAGGGPRISLLADRAVLGGDGRRISAMAVAGALHFRDGQWVQGDYDSRGLIELDVGGAPAVDLSRPDGQFSERQSEVFHYRSRPNAQSIACRVAATLGDRFDLIVFHNEFRIDVQEVGSPWTMYGGNIDVTGIGDLPGSVAPCGERPLLGHWTLPVWMSSRDVLGKSRHENERFDSGLLLFAHELTHAWTAYASYVRNGEREPLHGNYCRCHWRTDLHLPAAFPWHPYDPGPVSLMGGKYWRDNGDGTFTPLNGYWAGGHSWLDLYMMGLATADEVPDMFILRDLRPVREGDSYGPHTGHKEWVSINQVVAAEGRREPAAGQAQYVFNAGFVYLLEPGQAGQAPDPDMLGLHAQYRDKVVEHWSHITGGRSRITTDVPPLAPVPYTKPSYGGYRDRLEELLQGNRAGRP